MCASQDQSTPIYHRERGQSTPTTAQEVKVQVKIEETYISHAYECRAFFLCLWLNSGVRYTREGDHVAKIDLTLLGA